MSFKALISQSENDQLDTFLFSLLVKRNTEPEHHITISHYCHQQNCTVQLPLHPSLKNYQCILIQISPFPFCFSPWKTGSTKPEQPLPVPCMWTLVLNQTSKRAREALFPPQHIGQSNLNFFNDSSWQNLNCPAHSSPTLPRLVLPDFFFFLQTNSALSAVCSINIRCQMSDVSSCCQFISILWVQTASLLNRRHAHFAKTVTQKYWNYSRKRNKILCTSAINLKWLNCFDSSLSPVTFTEACGTLIQWCLISPVIFTEEHGNLYNGVWSTHKGQVLVKSPNVADWYCSGLHNYQTHTHTRTFSLSHHITHNQTIPKNQTIFRWIFLSKTIIQMITIKISIVTIVTSTNMAEARLLRPCSTSDESISADNS